MRILSLAALAVALTSLSQGQTDWPLSGHDAGGTRYSPLKQINAKNVTKLQVAWSFDTEAPVVETPGRGRRGGAAAVPDSVAVPDGAAVPAPNGAAGRGGPPASR